MSHIGKYLRSVFEGASLVGFLQSFFLPSSLNFDSEPTDGSDDLLYEEPDDPTQVRVVFDADAFFDLNKDNGVITPKEGSAEFLQQIRDKLDQIASKGYGDLYVFFIFTPKEGVEWCQTLSGADSVLGDCNFQIESSEKDIFTEILSDHAVCESDEYYCVLTQDKDLQKDHCFSATFIDPTVEDAMDQLAEYVEDLLIDEESDVEYGEDLTP